MQFQVPQFIETEDKIVGPLSLRQFLYAGGAVAISILFYFTLNTFAWIILSLPTLIAGIALAFVKVNGQALPRILISGALFYWKPQTYVWQPEHPDLPKSEMSIRSLGGGESLLEKLALGLALKRARERVETGSAPPGGFMRGKDRYEIFRGITGEPRAARRIDYR